MGYPRMWQKISGFETYRVSFDGRVKNESGRVLKQFLRDGRLCVNLYGNGKHHHQLVAHLVLEAFVGPRCGNNQSVYKDGNTRNVHVSNLAWKK